MTGRTKVFIGVMALAFVALILGVVINPGDEEPDSALPTRVSVEPTTPVIETPVPVEQPEETEQPAVAQPIADPEPTTQPPQTEPVVIPVSEEPVPGQVIVTFAETATDAERQAYVQALGGAIAQTITADTVVVQVPDTVAELPASPAVAASEPDYFVAAQQDDAPPVNDPLYPEQWALQVIGAPQAWAELPADAPRVTVAVIDSGVCLDHPELEGRILPDGYDFIEDDSVPQDEFGHGCAVSGIIAANSNNGIGIAGVAPNAMILPLRVLDANGVGTYSDVAAAIIYATDNGAEIINLSLGGSVPSDVLVSAIDYAIANDVTVVAAAGNTGGRVLWPAAYEPVIAVGSVDRDLTVSGFSARGDEVDVYAPGRDVLTMQMDGVYRALSGTSFAVAQTSSRSKAFFKEINARPCQRQCIFHLRGESISVFHLPNARDAHTLYGAGPDLFNYNRIIVQFSDDLHIRFDQQGNLASQILGSALDLSSFEALASGGVVGRLFQRSQDEIDQENFRAQGSLNYDLNSFYVIDLTSNMSQADALKLVNHLNALDYVATAYPEPIPQLTGGVDLWPTTPNYEGWQTYLNGAPNGVDAKYAWTVSGGNGQGINIVNIEFDWMTTHEDLSDDVSLIYGSTSRPGERNHGTAVIGTIAGANNGYGITGIAHGANMRLAGLDQSLSTVIDNVTAQLGPGDVITMSLAFSVDLGINHATCWPHSANHVPIDYYSDVFAAIQNATTSGITVLIAAGNGHVNLDHPAFEGKYDRSVQDSGAIIVGAGQSGSRRPTCFTNYGSRVDVHGIGENVMTLGYGNVFNGNGDENQFYNAGFNGTSSATPIVAGVVASIQGIAKQRGHSLSPSQVRDLLIMSGTAQQYGTEHIGPLPNLRTAIELLPLPNPEWDFSAPNGLQGWATNGHLANESEQFDGIYYDVVGSDPNIRISSLPGINADDYEYIVVEMKSTVDSCARIYFQRDIDSGFAETRQVEFAVNPDGGLRRYEVPMAAHHLWSGNISAIRLDFDCGSPSIGEINIGYIGFATSTPYWSFSTEDLRGWQPWKNMNNQRYDKAQRGFVWDIETDAYMISPELANIYAEDFQYMVIEMSSDTKDGNDEPVSLDCMAVYFQHRGRKDLGYNHEANGFNESQVETVNVYTQYGSDTTYFVDLSQNSNWNGEITRLRIDPSGCNDANGVAPERSGAVRINFIGLATNDPHWDLSDQNGAQGWHIGKRMDQPRQRPEGMAWSITANDPYLIGPVLYSVNASVYPYLHISMSADVTSNDLNLDQDCLQIYFTRGGDHFNRIWEYNFTDTQMITIETDVGYGVVRDYYFDMSSNPEWNGYIRQIRFDPAGGCDGNADRSGAVRIDRIELQSAPSCAMIDLDNNGRVTLNDTIALNIVIDQIKNGAYAYTLDFNKDNEVSIDEIQTITNLSQACFGG